MHQAGQKRREQTRGVEAVMEKSDLYLLEKEKGRKEGREVRERKRNRIEQLAYKSLL